MKVLKIFNKLTILLITIFTVLVVIVPPEFTSSESLCPSNMDPNSRECLNYLRDQITEINRSNRDIEAQLRREEYRQMSLEEQIAWVNNEIEQTTRIIRNSEIEIAALNVEIKIMEDNISMIEDNISLSKQEITQLEAIVNQRLTESYKYTFIGPLEIFLNSNDLNDVLRKTKYLLITRERDSEKLHDLSLKKEDLEIQELELFEQREDIEIVRNKLEDEQREILVQRSELDKQKREQASLLAQSERRTREMLATLDTNRSLQSKLDEEVMRYVSQHGDQMRDHGWVNAGDWIGNMGGLPSACSTGPHVHFSIDRMNSGFYHGYGELSPWTGGYLRKGPDYAWQSATGFRFFFVRSGSMRVPLGGSVILTQDYHVRPRKSIDITVLHGTRYGAPVYAAMPGNLSKGTDRCGETYAVIENPAMGIRTAYFHLQR